ncbi:hypothetical protein HK098_008367 [Nowakowskiella sp. JEL0407]|nr:hypothetical protein HK098_008367 [Nowakowskiella sp. JEL0407]
MGQVRNKFNPLVYQFHPSNALVSSEKEKDRLKTTQLDYFNVFFGPATGPRGFASCGFEKTIKQLHSQKQLSSPKWLIGGSTAALRFLAIVSSIISKRNINHEMKEHFCEMMYQRGDTAAVLRPMMEAMYRICAPPELRKMVLNHPDFRIGIMVARVKDTYSELSDWSLKVTFGAYFFMNMLDPKYLEGFIDRICFYTGSEPPTFLDGDENTQKIKFVPLTEDNIYEVLHATTCIPFVQERCDYISGIGPGLYFDAAVTDLTLNSNISDSSVRALILGDLPNNVVKQTAFDTLLPWRNLPPSYRENVSVLCPSPEFVKLLPEQKLPSVHDWFNGRYIDDPELRKKNWREAYNLSLRSFDGNVFMDGWVGGDKLDADSEITMHY